MFELAVEDKSVTSLIKVQVSCLESSRRDIVFFLNLRLVLLWRGV